jgi:hypothetical protein
MKPKKGESIVRLCEHENVCIDRVSMDVICVRACTFRFRQAVRDSMSEYEQLNAQFAHRQGMRISGKTHATNRCAHLADASTHNCTCARDDKICPKLMSLCVL